MEKRLRIACQKSGRLSKETHQLLHQSGINFVLNSSQLLIHANNMPIDILLVRSGDIPGLVMDGVADLGITGENTLEENNLNRLETGQNNHFDKIMSLGFGKCKLAIAIPKNIKISDNLFDYLQQKTVATSYPYLLKKFMEKNKTHVKTCFLNGSVEVASKAKLADAICDIVSTGLTLDANGLKAVKTIFHSQAVLIQKNNPSNDFKDLVDKLVIRFSSVIKARESKYIMLHAPKNALEEVVKLLPCAEKPTIIPLAYNEDKVALHVVTSENLFWETMESLKNKGCSSILVLPVEKMMD